MKVGIITVHSVPNYGAMLQAYALASHLLSQGHQTHTIDYRQPQLESVYRLKWRVPPPLNQWMRLRRCNAFVHRRLPLSPGQCRSISEFLPMVDQYDAFITGSDQVWFTGPVQYFDPMYFLEFPAPGKRKISYAASAGGVADFGEFEGRVKGALADFQHIGVRDSHTMQLVAPLAPVQPVQVVDPVFLSDFAALSGVAPLPQPYLLVFGDFSRHGAVLRSIIEATGLKTVVTLQYRCDQATQRIPAPGPSEWLNWFRHAAFVVTSYFHGTAIAAKFGRPFIAIPTSGRRTKVTTMLEWMGLQDRCVAAHATADTCASLARTAIPWEEVRYRVDEQVRRSKAFLEESLR